MTTNHALRALKAEQNILNTLQRRRRRYAELKAIASGGAIVFTGLLLATIYGLLTNRIPL